MGILSAAQSYCMFSPGDLVIAAVSGGPDSVAMLHALHSCSSELQIEIHVAHVNHGLRGFESDLDQKFVSELATSFGLSCHCRRVDVPQLREQTGMGEEEAARELRYAFLLELRATLNADKIAVAHNANDRAESVLLNVIRGSGTSGLGSIRPVRGCVVRPLIQTCRDDIMAYVEKHGLPYRIDESNMDTSYARNRIRHELLPLLQSNYNPRILEALNRLADIALAEDEYLALASSSALNRTRMSDGLDAGLLCALPAAIRRRAVRTEIEKLKGNLLDVSLEQIDRVIGYLSEGGDFTVTLPSGKLYALRRGHRFRIERMEYLETPSFDYKVEIPGLTAIPESGVIIEASLLQNAKPRRLPPDEVLIDLEAITGTLRARSLRPGDRIAPFGMRQHKKLQDVFVDKKISRAKRATAVVVEDSEKILWVPGVVASEKTRIDTKARDVVRLRVDKLE